MPGTAKTSRYSGTKGQPFDLTRSLVALGARMVQDVQHTIQAMGKIDTGELYNSITATVQTEDGIPISVSRPALEVR